MARPNKRLEQMRRNPKGDWSIRDIEVVCRAYADLGVRLRPPKGGSHYTVSHPAIAEILTIPHRRPLLPVYVRKFVSFVDTVLDIAEPR